jgi:acetoin utilization deacetylase AcuC-like enzyme
MGAGHPESPQRLTAIEAQIQASELGNQLTYFKAPLGTAEQLLRVHDADYLTAIEHSSPQSGLRMLDPDTAMNPHTLTAARRAAGAAVFATDLVLEGKVNNAFCAVRPPGHHAEHARAMGFCIFNNVAVAAAHALEQHGLKHIAIVDFDVHHGNGTENIFENDERVLMVSTFQHPFYPGSGIQGRSERMVNVPLAAGSGSTQFRAAVVEHWLPAFERFQPEMLFISAGFDAHGDDDLAQLQLREDDYFWVTQQLRVVADKYAAGRIVAVLEGGYDLPALGRSVVAHLQALV